MYKNKYSIKVILLILSVAFVFETNAQLNEIKNRETALKKELKFEDWAIKKNQKREGVNLSTQKVKALENIKEVKPKKLFYISKTQNDSSFIQYRSKWMESVNSFLEITVSYLDSPNDAQNYMMDYYILGSSLPNVILLKSKDEPVLVGDASFFNGQLFVRDNIIVKIYSEGLLQKQTLDIAKEIDSLLLSQSISDLKSNVKPRLQKDKKGNISIIEP
jgi:hypothetical protein